MLVWVLSSFFFEWELGGGGGGGFFFWTKTCLKEGIKFSYPKKQNF